MGIGPLGTLESVLQGSGHGQIVGQQLYANTSHRQGTVLDNCLCCLAWEPGRKFLWKSHKGHGYDETQI